jgi:MFS family permease
MRPDAVRLIGSWSLAHFGFRAALIAMPLLAIEQTGSAWTVGLVSGAGGVPAITAPWWTGPFQRRLTSGRALAAMLAGEGLATLVAPGAAGLDLLSPALMVAAGLLIGTLNAVSGPLNASLVATVGDALDEATTGTGRDGRGTGAARLLAVQETAVKLAMTVAPLVALPLVAVFGAAWTVATEGLLSLAAATLVASLRLSTTGSSPAEPPKVRTLLRHQPRVARGWTIRGVGCAAWFAFTLGLPILGQQRGSGLALATVGLAAYSGGAIVGSALGMLTASSARPGMVNGVAWLVAGGGWTLIAWAPTLPVIAVTAALMGLVVPMGNAATTALVTRTWRGHERRAALTAQATVVTGSSTLGMLLGGPLIAILGARTAIGVSGVAVALPAAVVTIAEYSRGRRGVDRLAPASAGRPEPRPSAREVSHDRERQPGRELPRLQRRRRGPAAVDG